MTIDDTGKDLVRRHIDLSWNKADFDALDAVWSDEAVVHLWDGRTLTGLQELKEHLRASVLAWTDRLCEIEELVAEGDFIANRWSFRGADPTGDRWTMSGMDFYRVSDGKLFEEWIALGTPAKG